jgi:hypothetical protein
MASQSLLERQLAASVAEAQQRKREDIDDWLEAAPVPPKRLKRTRKMSETALAKVQTENIVRSPVDAMAEWRAMREQASTLVESGFLPRAVNTPEKAIAIIQTGKELGLGPMQALRSIHIIEGKPSMSADLIAGLALQRVPGSTLRVAESTDSKCVVEAARPGHPTTKFTWTMQDAQRAGIANKDNWKKYPRAMLRARCITEAARAVMPDAVVGLYDPDELGAVTNEAGQVVDVPYVAEVTPFHGAPEGEQPGLLSAAEFVRTRTEQLERLKSDIAYCKTWEEMVKLRAECGSPAVQSQILRELQENGPDKRIISGAQHKELSKIWQHCHRQLTALEGKLKPPPVEASFTDEPDGTEAFAPEREAGEEG